VEFLRPLAAAFMLSVAVSACSGQTPTTPTTSPTAATHGALTTQQSCDQQHWPQPVPADLVGKLIGEVLDTDATICFNFAKALAPDGHDVLADENGRQASSAWRIIAVTPPSGTEVDQNQPIVLTVQRP
jgi:hypothetical protein